jgi:hypothetical protein
MVKSSKKHFHKPGPLAGGDESYRLRKLHGEDASLPSA